ncbi:MULTISPECIES: hypothetical protein [Pectobacterium]|uniref:hypothetical protein n=1 Tax=Pectobacterium TaxID=122277 RepID=UPI001C5F133E|nr:hypothetical protein [Pectobacterium sp. CFBP8739]
MALFVRFSGHALANTANQVESSQQKAQDIQRQIDDDAEKVLKRKRKRAEAEQELRAAEHAASQ